MNMLILEGPRGVGKTTLSADIQRALHEYGYSAYVLKVDRGYNWLSSSRTSPAHGMAAIVECAASVESPSGILIVDRFINTELVMRQVDGSLDNDPDYRETLLQLEEFIALKMSDRLLQIIVLGHPKTIQMRIPERVPELGASAENIYEEWVTRAKSTKLNTEIMPAIDGRKNMLDSAMPVILEWLAD